MLAIVRLLVDERGDAHELHYQPRLHARLLAYSTAGLGSSRLGRQAFVPTAVNAIQVSSVDRQIEAHAPRYREERFLIPYL